MNQQKHMQQLEFEKITTPYFPCEGNLHAFMVNIIMYWAVI